MMIISSIFISISVSTPEVSGHTFFQSLEESADKPAETVLILIIIRTTIIATLFFQQFKDVPQL